MRIKRKAFRRRRGGPRFFAELPLSKLFREPLIVLDKQLRGPDHKTARFLKVFHVTKEEKTAGKFIYGPRRQTMEYPALRHLPGRDSAQELAKLVGFSRSITSFPKIGRRNMILNARPPPAGRGRPRT